jgi:thiol-disulfide isomerase/thioredoxin
MSRKSRRSGTKRSYTPWIILGLVVVTAVVGYYIFTSSGAGSGSPLNNTPVSQTILSQLSGVRTATLELVGSSQPNVSPTKPTTNTTPLTLNGKPEVLYMGAEYCPYCAAERWAMIVALDKFGNFSGLQYMQSDSTDIYPNSPTFTFVGASYTSSYISFVSVEQSDRNGAPLQSATSEQTSLLNTYDTGGTIPFVDFANLYVITSAQYLPSVLRAGNTATGAPYDWTQIASQLDNASSIFALNIDGAANHLISAICKIDGGAPSSVCSQSFAQTVSYFKPSNPSGSQLLASDAMLRGGLPSAEASRFALNRGVARI